MNIILGESAVKEVGDKYTVLKLDKITIGSSTPITAYCVVETIPIDELPLTESLKKMHDSLMEQFYQRQWNFCEQAIEQLVGKWNGEIDSFYSDLHSRINTYKVNEPDESWTGIVAK